MIVNARFLSVSTNNKSCFTTFKCTISMIFNLINPLAFDCFLVFRQIHNFPSFILFQSFKLFSHCFLPDGLRSSLLIRERFMNFIKLGQKMLSRWRKIRNGNGGSS
ncbi:hypothetical protein HanIR_Chr17g0894651 [Helianthus annuus]|nr:hypothetical protein HanIR_Chr17g0894651 [Helianthus annuus]